MNIPYLSQNNYPNYVFPVHSGSSMSGTGCGIVSTTMVLRYLTDKDIKVQDVATWADNNGHFNGIGSNGSLFQAAAKKWNAGKVVRVSKENFTTVKRALRRGRPVISYQGPGIFTQHGHFIVLKGIDKNGNIHVNNPNKTQKIYTPEQINRNAVSYYIFDAKTTVEYELIDSSSGVLKNSK